MTGFGRSSHSSENLLSVVEISSVNRKQVELAFSAARELSALEPRIRAMMLPHISRGRVQVSLHVGFVDHADRPIELDAGLARGLERAYQQLSSELGRTIVPQSSDFLQIPGIIRMKETVVDVEQAWAVLEPALCKALDSFQESRRHEGAALLRDFLQRLDTLQGLLQRVEEAAQGRSARQGEILRRRLAELDCPVPIDDERLCKEIALFADRCDISEEITRLRSHIAQFHQYLSDNPAPGRALDFLCQEIHREWNTVGSKALDAGIGQVVVEAKTELEKIREQVQNIE
ncbi:MAG: hypothetical protein RI957_739 [Verrucomicrobiota bacterium]